MIGTDKNHFTSLTGDVYVWPDFQFTNLTRAIHVQIKNLHHDRRRRYCGYGQDVQDLLLEKEVEKVNLMEMEFEINQIDSEDNDEDCEINNLTLKKLQEGLSLTLNELKILNHFS